MRIKNPDNKSFSRFLRKFIFRKKVIAAAFILIVLVIAYKASGFAKTKGYSGLWDFVSTVSGNYMKGRKANPESISIEIKDNDFKILEKKRAKALERGVIINDIDGEYVPATLDYEGKKLKINLRLKGHMTDHLQDNKWSFRIKVKDKDSFMGMKRFSIQHPGTRGYIYEWIYHELMKREDVIALRYKFINVTVNGRDWGIYAVEENFEEELVANNNRPKGPILRYNPDLYWINRYNMMENTATADEFASYYSANPEAYREKKVLADSDQKKYYQKAIALMEGLRERKISVDEAFDIPRMAKFHAIIDLVGGTHSIDWSDIKYYYNPVTARLEPVAYESFTELENHDLSALYKYVQPDSSQNYRDWHTMIFSNELFFKEYIKQLNRITQQSYLDAFFNESNEELNKNLAIIYREFPYKKFDAYDYYKRANIIQKIINPPKAIHAYFKQFENGAAHLQVGAIDALPVQLRSISINGVESQTSLNVLPAKQVNTFVKFKEFIFTMPADFKWKDILADSVMINYSVLGSSEIKTAKVFPFPHTKSEFIAKEMQDKKANVDSFDFILHSKKEGESYTFKAGKITISEDLIIPPNATLFINAGTTIDLINHARLISYSPLACSGTEDEPVIFSSTDSTSGGIELMNAARSVFNYVIFKNLPQVQDQQWNRSGALTFYESPVEFKNCSFYNCKAENAVSLIRSHFLFKECLFNKMQSSGLDAIFSEGSISDCVFEQCGKNAINSTMGTIKLNSVYVDGAGNKALNIKDGSQLTGNNLRIKNANIGISAEDQSAIELQQVSISNTETGIVAYRAKATAGHPKVTVSGLKMTNVKKKYLKEKKSTLIVNGTAVKEEVNEVETIIKN